MTRAALTLALVAALACSTPRCRQKCRMLHRTDRTLYVLYSHPRGCGSSDFAATGGNFVCR